MPCRAFLHENVHTSPLWMWEVRMEVPIVSNRLLLAATTTTTTHPPALLVKGLGNSLVTAVLFLYYCYYCYCLLRAGYILYLRTSPERRPHSIFVVVVVVTQAAQSTQASVPTPLLLFQHGFANDFFHLVVPVIIPVWTGV
jgi:hypothetical protein